MTPPFTPPFTILSSFQDLCDYLAEEAVAYTADAATPILEIPTRLGALAGALFVRWELHLPLVQVISPMVVNVPPERLAAVEHCLVRLNHAVPLAGFALDHERRFAYFRLTLQRDDLDRIWVPQLNRALCAVVTCARDFLPALYDAAQPAGAPLRAAA